MEDIHISRDPEIMSGALCFKGTRVPVQNLFDYLEGASSLEDFLQDFPSISREAAIAVLEAAMPLVPELEETLASLQPCRLVQVGV